MVANLSAEMDAVRKDFEIIDTDKVYLVRPILLVSVTVTCIARPSTLTISRWMYLKNPITLPGSSGSR